MPDDYMTWNQHRLTARLDLVPILLQYDSHQLTACSDSSFFQGGTLMHKERAARAAYVQADEQYRSTVLTAFQNVADTLHALEQDADGLKAAVASRDAAKVTLDLSPMSRLCPCWCSARL